MKCKNCQHTLENDAQFCDNCGAKVVKNRITFKFLLTEIFTNVFGLDNKFFLTIRKMLTHPEDVLNEYLSGVRKRYVNPFSFFAIAAAISLLVYNFFAEDYLAFQASVNSEQVAEIKELANKDLSTLTDISKEELKKLQGKKLGAQLQLKFMDKMAEYMLRYFNLIMFMFLPVYALLSKWTFPKPHNFGEHIVMNAYVYGFTTLFSIIAFLLSIAIHPKIYFFSMLIYIFYYLYVFKRLYNLSFGKTLLKLIRFLIGFAIMFFIIAIAGGVIGFLAGLFGLIEIPKPQANTIYQIKVLQNLV